MQGALKIKAQLRSLSNCYSLVQTSNKLEPPAQSKSADDSLVSADEQPLALSYSSRAAGGMSSAALLIKLAGKAALFSRMSISIS